MKYTDLTLGQVEAIVNLLGGMDGVRQFLRGEIEPVPLERVQSLSDTSVAWQLTHGASTLRLGKVWQANELPALVEAVNATMVRSGEPTWRLPTKEELLASLRSKDGRFGKWFTWSGDSELIRPGCFWIVNMRDGDVWSDSDGSAVEAYLVQTKITKHRTSY